MNRRRFLLSGTVTALAMMAGCTTELPNDDETSTADRQVTTSGATSIDLELAGVVVRDDLDGPAVNYRLRNAGDEDATVKIRTVLAIEGGDSYERSAYLSIPAGDVVTVTYVVVSAGQLTEDEQRSVDRGETSVETYVNGERRNA